MLNQPGDDAFHFGPPKPLSGVAMGEGSASGGGSGLQMLSMGTVGQEGTSHLHPSMSQPRAPGFGQRPTRPIATPPRRRSGAPNSIPHFPTATEPRDAPRASGFTPSPSVSPGPGSPFKLPHTPSTPPSLTPFKLPTMQPITPAASAGSSYISPWHTLAATSGAPTPSLGGPGRSSPHLGGPFEQLNLNGSWSSENLRAEDSAERKPSTGGQREGAQHTAGESDTNADLLAKYRSMAGRASVTGGTKPVTSHGGENVNASTSDPSCPPLKLNLPSALARRRASLPKAGLGISSSTAASTSKTPSPLAFTAPLSGKASQSSEIKPLLAVQAVKILGQSTTLALDVRPPSAYTLGHVPSALSIPVPSTLLRRPAFTVAKVISMLSLESQLEVQEWRSKANIVILDQDSTKVEHGTLLEGLASKFQREGFGGQLWFVKGGQSSLEEADAIDMDHAGSENSSRGSETPSGQRGPTLHGSGLLSSGLGHFAFQHGSTGGGTLRADHSEFPFTPAAGSHGNPFDTLGIGASRVNGGSGGSGSSKREFPLSLKGMMIDSTGPSRNSSVGSFGSFASGGKPKLQPANPFFDNIRQNLELSHGGITERIPLSLPEDEKRRAHELPGWLGELVMLNDKDVAERLAQQFYTVERSEQKRLQALMDWHSEGSGMVLPPTTSSDLGQKGKETTWAAQKLQDQDDVERLALWKSGMRSPSASTQENYYPFSITAGVERGTKNRYKNIWPYDFSRVRLEAACEDQSDYINASYIQPRGTSRRYIATQGPLDATYRDFWTLVWEQDVRVIVMLTKQFEGGLIKCGNYWQDQDYGSLHVHLEHQAGGEDVGRPAQPSGFDFGMPAPAPTSVERSANGEPQNIRREFYLSHASHPDQPPRKVVQLQCVSWPDFDVPESPEVLLGLIHEVDAVLREDERDSAKGDRVDEAPVLVHCSAGVGRTGSFIVVDSILDALTRQRQVARRTYEDAAPIALRSASVPTGQPSHQVKRSSAQSEDVSPTTARQGSGDSLAEPPKSAISASAAGSFDSGRSRAQHRREKSVTFAPSDTVALNNGGAPDHRKATASSPINSSHQSSHIMQNNGLAKAEDDGMDVDPPAVLSPEIMAQPDAWLQYREDDKTSDAGTVITDRRPSLASIHTSDDKMNTGSLPPVEEEPRPIKASGDRERSPTPLDELENPVLDVLESMRVQRMSLVQSLRQFVFVYKVIIHQYFAMLDEENERDHTSLHSSKSQDPTSIPPIQIPNSISAASESGDETDLHSASTTEPTSVSSSALHPPPSATSGTSVTSGNDMEDDTKPKRRASPTELMHDRTLVAKVTSAGAEGAIGKVSKGTEAGLLGRKASVKRMRQDNGGAGSNTE